jgi:mono/diheme cytochrome c family protein
MEEPVASRLHLIALAVAALICSAPPPRPLLAHGGDASAAAGARLPGNAEHGQYIAEHVAMCVECHSGRDDHGNILDSQRFLGAPIPSLNASWPADWAIRAPRNRGLPGYDDDQAMRLLTQGAIGRNGAQLRPPMPRFRMTPQDAADVIAFLRSLR